MILCLRGQDKNLSSVNLSNCQGGVFRIFLYSSCFWFDGERKPKRIVILLCCSFWVRNAWKAILLGLRVAPDHREEPRTYE